MSQIRTLLPLVVITALVLIAVVAFGGGAPVLAQPNLQATATPAANASGQTYVTLLPSAAGATRLLVITLSSDGKLNVVNDPIGSDPAVTQVGTWKADGDTVTLTITGDGKVNLAKAVTVVFKRDGENLVATEFDKSIFGDKPFTLYQRDAVEARLAALNQSYVTVDLAAGFPLDPFLVSVNGGGDVDASILNTNCKGFINGNPTVTVNWTGKTDLVRAFTYSDADPILVIQTPDGKFLCGDDTGTLVLDSQIELANPAAGKYNIWVGSSAAKQLLPTILVLTTRPDVNLGTFQLGQLVKRPPQPVTGPQGALQAKIVTEAIARFKGTVNALTAAKALTQNVKSAGTLGAFDINFGDVKCNGFIADTPDFVFDISSATPQAAVFLQSKQDASLLVVGPDGKVFCNDDSADGNSNPLLKLVQPVQGRYAVFVGRLNQDAPVEGTLTVTTDANAAPSK